MYIYGPQDTGDKLNLWSRLSSFKTNHVGHYIIFGDFNEVHTANDRFGSVFNATGALAFNNFINDAELFDMPLGGLRFTWMNKSGSKMSHIDRFLISHEVMNEFPEVKLEALNRAEDMQVSLFDKCGRLKEKIKGWMADKRITENTRKKLLQDKIQEIDIKLDNTCASLEEIDERTSNIKELEDFMRMEELDIQQKARLKWNVEGDENSKYFHGLINSRRHQQMVNGILIDGVWNTNPHFIKKEFVKFYAQKFDNHESGVRFPLITISNCLSTDDNLILEGLISE
ncbi:uncharacterized protein [Rutidosis leptorrhynchoides]|uniref:uncharacterized protein n=1 Tax=Rutidosis leptorrhynchoides TaxID=125765 RepID=UPI003A9A048D